jgi:IS5 family transposase
MEVSVTPKFVLWDKFRDIREATPNFVTTRRSFHDVKGLSEASLDLMERAKDHRDKVLREQNGQQNRSKAAWRWWDKRKPRLQRNSPSPSWGGVGVGGLAASA